MDVSEAMLLAIAEIEELRQAVFIPWDKGNMATHGLQYEVLDGGKTLHIYMDLSQASYTPYTNEPWLSPRWHGKTNPNEGWWNEWCDTFMKRLATKLQGNLK